MGGGEGGQEGGGNGKVRFLHVWRVGVGETGKVDRKEGEGGGISQMEYLGGLDILFPSNAGSPNW